METGLAILMSLCLCLPAVVSIGIFFNKGKRGERNAGPVDAYNDIVHSLRWRSTGMNWLVNNMLINGLAKGPDQSITLKINSLSFTNGYKTKDQGRAGLILANPVLSLAAGNGCLKLNI